MVGGRTLCGAEIVRFTEGLDEKVPIYIDLLRSSAIFDENVEPLSKCVHRHGAPQ